MHRNGYIPANLPPSDTIPLLLESREGMVIPSTGAGVKKILLDSFSSSNSHNKPRRFQISKNSIVSFFPNTPSNMRKSHVPEDSQSLIVNGALPFKP